MLCVNPGWGRRLEITFANFGSRATATRAAGLEHALDLIEARSCHVAADSYDADQLSQMACHAGSELRVPVEHCWNHFNSSALVEEQHEVLLPQHLFEGSKRKALPGILPHSPQQVEAPLVGDTFWHADV
jgi:hypothetical protein